MRPLGLSAGMMAHPCDELEGKAQSAVLGVSLVAVPDMSRRADRVTVLRAQSEADFELIRAFRSVMMDCFRCPAEAWDDADETHGVIHLMAWDEDDQIVGVARLVAVSPEDGYGSWSEGGMRRLDKVLVAPDMDDARVRRALLKDAEMYGASFMTVRGIRGA